MEITVVDYGLSNLLSVKRALETCGAQVEITGSRSKVLGAKVLVLPGVGAFKDGMQGLRELSLADAICEKAQSGTPLLGICLGMQMLFEESDEFGCHKGLGLIGGRVEGIPLQDISGEAQRVPHIGWNGLLVPEGQVHFTVAPLLDTKPGSEVYFVHSYEAKPTRDKDRAADTIYGGRRVCAAAASGSVFGCQFHPEKSGEIGLGILRSFLAACHA